MSSPIRSTTSFGRLVARDVVVDAPDGQRLLQPTQLSFVAGEVVAIVGGSGAGKTTLLQTLAGIRQASSGSVSFDGLDVGQGAARRHLGFVPQDDIIHLDLSLRRTLQHAARLRLPRGTTRLDVELAAERVMEELDLADRADVRVRDLSGGQRKRASIAVELLTHPEVLFLDEPTSGLDPATAAHVLRVLRRLAGHGTTVVLTSHAPSDVLRCDRVLVMARGGQVVHDATPAGAVEWFGVQRFEDVYEVVDQTDPSAWLAKSVPSGAWLAPAEPGRLSTRPEMAGATRQMATLAHRAVDMLAHNRLTASILLGSPALVITMMTVLFQQGVFAPDGGDPIAAVQLVYWIAFAGFFFGLTYGLLQIVTETAVLRREQAWGVSTAAYVVSKLVVLLPLLALVDGALLATLGLTDRLPSLTGGEWFELGALFLLDAGAGLALGLLASALVTNAAQATLALPMLCFPQVLFAGAMVPVSSMTTAGDAISTVMSNRWAFEAIGRVLDLPGRLGAPMLGGWAEAFVGGPAAQLVALAAMVAVCCVATVRVLAARAR